MAGIGSFFTSLSSSFTSLSIFKAKYYDEKTVEVKGANSAVEDKTLRVIREAKASRKQASDQLRTIVDVAEQVNKQSREASQARVNAAHETIGAQTKQGRTAVSYGAREQLLDSKLNEVNAKIRGLGGEEKVSGKRKRGESEAPLRNPVPVKKQNTQKTTPSERREKKLRQLMTPKFSKMSPDFQIITLNNNGIDNPQEARKQMRGWAKEDAEKERLKAEEPPKTKVRQSVQNEWGVDLQNGDRVNIPLMEYEKRNEESRWRSIARKTFRNKDVDSVRIGKEPALTREEAENLGWLRGDGKGGGGKSGGGRGMGG